MQGVVLRGAAASRGRLHIFPELLLFAGAQSSGAGVATAPSPRQLGIKMIKATQSG